MRRFIILVVALVSATTPALSKDFLPIRQGMYVRASVACRNAPNADVQAYFGNSLSYGHGGCDIVRVNRTGRIFRITARCRDVGDNAPEQRVTQTWQVFSANEVIMDGEHYRWCGNSMQDLWK